MQECLKRSHIICICEGAAEEVIIRKLYDNGLLHFKNTDRHDGQKLIRTFTRTRKVKKVEEIYLHRDYGNIPLVILRILDSRSEKFTLSRVFSKRIREEKIRIINVLTRPEIEMLVIINEDHYDKFSKNKSKIKPSTYCKRELRFNEVKKQEFVSDYFSDIDDLVEAIRTYNQYSQDDRELNIFDLLETHS